MAQYERYRFTTDFKTDDPNDVEYSWLKFLRAYFEATKRVVSGIEPDNRRFLPQLPVTGPVPIESVLDQDIASLIYNGEGTPDLRGALAIGDKSDPTDKTGGDYEAVTIKNFPRDTRTRGQRMQRAVTTFPIFEAFGLIDRKSVNGQNGKNRQCVSNPSVSYQGVPEKNGKS
jgi:hypothetical protein